MFINMRALKIKTLLAVILMFVASVGHSANRYWVNGSGSWNDINHWSEISGGKPGASVPTKSDNVIFDNNSFTAGGQQVLIKDAAECNDFRWEVENVTPVVKSKSFLFKDVTKAAIHVFGSLIINENIDNQFFGDIKLKAEDESQIIIKSQLNSNLIFDNENGSWVLKSDLSTTKNIQLNAGFLNLNDQQIDCSSFIGTGKGMRSLNVGNSTILVEKWNFEETQNLNYIFNDYQIVSKSTINQDKYKLGNLTYPSISIISSQYSSKALITIDSTKIVQPTCFGGTNGSMTVYIKGGTPNYTYKLHDGSSQTAPVLVSYTGPETSHIFTGLKAKIYFLVVTDIGNITGGKQEVTQPAELLGGTITVAKGLTCSDGNDAILQANPTGGTLPYTYDWFIDSNPDPFVTVWTSIGQNTKQAINIGTGIYQVVIKDKFNCKGSVTSNIFFTNPPQGATNVPPAITITTTTSTNSCGGAPDGTITIAASGGTGDMDYFLMQGLTQFPSPGYDEDGIFTGLLPGTYETYAIDANLCIKRGSDITITATVVPIADAGTGGSTCGLTFNLSAVPSVGTGTWTKTAGPGTASFSNANSATSTVTVTQYGVYTFTWTENNNGCIDSDDVIVTFNETPIANAGTDQYKCNTLIATLAGNTPTIGTGTWTKFSGPGTVTFSNANSATSTATVSLPGTYVLRWTIDNSGCTHFDDVSIAYAEQAAAGPDQNLCGLLVATLAGNVPSAGTGTWTKIGGPGTVTFSNANLNNATATVSQYGTYVLRWTINNGGGCSTFDEVTINYSATANAGPDQNLCGTLVATLAALSPGAGTGTWTKVSGPGSVTFSNANAINSTATVSLYGTYVLRWTIDNGGTCSTQDDVTITYADQAAAGPDQNLCNTLVATLAATAPSFGTGTWTKVSGPGTVTFGSVNVNNTTATVSVSGTYVLRWTVANGAFCTTQDDVTISFADLANAGTDQNLCGTFVATLAGNTPSAGTGTWTKFSGPGTVTFSNANSATSTATVSLYGTYVLRWTISNGSCSTQDDVTITYADQANAGPDQNLCNTLIATLAANAPTVGAGTWSKISGPGTVTFGSANINNTTATVSLPGIYVLRWTIANGAFCSTQDDVTISFAEQATAGPDQNLCGVLIATLAGNTPSAGTGLWSKISGPGTVTFSNASSATSTATVSLPGSYVLRWTLTNGSCSTQDEVTINFAAAANAGADQFICGLFVATLAGNAPGVGTGTWTKISGPGNVVFSDANLNNSTATVDAYGVYVLRWTIDNAGFCNTFDEVTVSYADLSAAGPDQSLCGVLTTTLAGNTPTVGTGTWTKVTGPGTVSFTNANLNNTSVTVSTYGIYVLRWTISNSGNCSSTDEVTINFTEAPTVFAGADTLVCYGTPYKVPDADTTNAVSISWSTLGDGSFDFINIINPTYTPGTSDLSTGYVDLVLTASSSNPLCVDQTDIVRINYLPELVATIGKPSPYFIDSTSTHIDVYIKISNFDYLAYLGIYLISPSDTIIELKPYCEAIPPGNFTDGATLNFYNDPLDTTSLVAMSACNPASGSYKFSGSWAQLHGQDPANGLWRVAVVNNFNVGDVDGLIEEAAISFRDYNNNAEFEQVLYADSSLNVTIIEWDGSGDFEMTQAVPSITGITTSCFGSCDAAIVATGYGGLPPYISFEWSTTDDFSSVFANTDTVEVCAGTYYLRITDSHGCIAIDSVVVSEPDEIFITNDSIVNITCYGDSAGAIMLQFTGGTGNLTYSIDSINWFASGYVFENLGAGSYDVIIRDLSGCFKDTTIVLVQPDSIDISVTHTDVTCWGDNDGTIQITAIGGQGPLEYSIDSGATYFDNGGLFINLPGDTFYIAVIDSVGCERIWGPEIVYEPDSVSIDSVKVNLLSCVGGGTDGQIIVYGSGGVGELYYSIDGGAFATDSSFSGLTEGFYQMAVRDDNGCTKLLDSLIHITYAAPIIVDSLFITDVSGCYGDSTGQVRVYASGGSGTLSYEFRGVTQTANLFIDQWAGTDTIFISDEAGCQIDTVITLNQPTELIIDSIYITHIRNCVNIDSLGTIIIDASGGTGAYQYSIDSSVTYFANSGFYDLNEGKYYVFVQDANGCLAEDTAVITTPEELLVTSDVQNIYCLTSTPKDPALSNGRIIATVTGGSPEFTYLWSGPAGFTANDDTIRNLSVVGEYTLIVTDNRGCEQYDTLAITEDPAFDISSSYVLDTNNICSYTTGINFTLTTTNVDTVFWQLIEEGFVPPVVETLIETSPQVVHFDPLISTDYRMTLVNEFCYDEYPKGSDPKILVHVNQGVGLSILDDYEEDDDTVNVKITQSKYTLKGMVQNITVNATYIWTPTTGLQNANVLETDLTPDVARWYYLSALTVDGCAELDSIFINFIPNVFASGGFSPNGDPYNDYWNIEGIDDFPNNLVEVYTRWGIKVFSQKGYSNLDPSKRWDGRAGNGNDLPTGTYYYIIITNEGGYKPITGPVTIVR